MSIILVGSVTGYDALGSGLGSNPLGSLGSGLTGLDLPTGGYDGRGDSSPYESRYGG